MSSYNKLNQVLLTSPEVIVVSVYDSLLPLPIHRMSLLVLLT